MDSAMWTRHREDSGILGSPFWKPAVAALALLASAPLWGQGTLPSSKDARPGSSSAHQDCARACHRPHNASLGRLGSQEFNLEGLCLSCHQGQPAMPTADRAPRLTAGAFEISSHLKARSRRKAATFRREVESPGKRKLVLQEGCSACHDMHGHEAGMVRPVAFDTRGQLVGSKPASFAQVCFGCHAGPEAVQNSRTDADLGQRFNTGTGSRHAIGASATDRMDLPSLRGSPFKGKLDCTSCHDNPDTTSMRGPHTSPYPSLLKAAYGREKDTGGLAVRSNELCFTCHSKTSILSNQSFPTHNEHITGFVGSANRSFRKEAPTAGAGLRAKPGTQFGRDPRTGRTVGYLPGFGEPTPCATCHEPHGSVKNAALVEFDRAVVGPSSVGSVDFRRTGLRQGNCTLTCHGYDHVQTPY